MIKAISDAEEGRRVSGFIVEQKTRYHLQNKDIAILYRTNAQSRVFEEHLRRQNIAYRVFGGLSFYQRKEVKDALAYLRLVINLKDDEALKRIINYPKRGIGATTMSKVSAVASQQNTCLWDALATFEATGRSRAQIAEFYENDFAFSRQSSFE